MNPPVGVNVSDSSDIRFCGLGPRICAFVGSLRVHGWHVACGEDMPRETNCVTLHPTEKDQFGMPIPNVHFDDHENDIAMRDHAYERGATVYGAVGATRIIRTPPGPSSHNLGTCRLSHRPEDGVCSCAGCELAAVRNE